MSEPERIKSTVSFATSSLSGPFPKNFRRFHAGKNISFFETTFTSKSSKTNCDAAHAKNIDAANAGIASKSPSGCCVANPQRKYSRGINPRPITVPRPITKIGVNRLNQPPNSHNEEAIKENANP